MCKKQTLDIIQWHFKNLVLNLPSMGFTLYKIRIMQKSVRKRKQYLALKEETKIQVGFPGRKQQIGLKAAKKNP